MGKFAAASRNSAYCPTPCGKPATHKVVGSFNALYGYFCKKHAKAKVKFLERTDKQEEK